MNSRKRIFILIPILLIAIQIHAQDIGILPQTYIPVSPRLDSIIQASLPDFNIDSLRQTILELEDFQTRFALADNRKDVAIWIQNKFLQYGCDEAVLDSFPALLEYPISSGIFHYTWQYNVVGTLTGSHDPAIEYVIGGHYDNILYPVGDPFVYCPGADDNGTAIATLFETLRVFKIHQFHPRSTVRFIGFAAEEFYIPGSRHYAQRADSLNQQIKLMINIDMIGYDTNQLNPSVNIYLYDKTSFLGPIAKYITWKNTNLIPDVEVRNEYGSDSYAFYEEGFASTFINEDIFSPNMHALTDVDSNINYPYFRASAMASCGILMASCMAPSAIDFVLFNPGNGNSLVATWSPAMESGISCYRVFVGRSASTYDTIITTRDTLIEIVDLKRDTTYYIGVCAVNEIGYQGAMMEKSDAPVLVTMDQGVLVVEDSKGSINNAPDTTIANYYTGMVKNYKHAYYNANTAGKISLVDMGPYIALLWHCNMPHDSSVIFKDSVEIVKYLSLGGKIIFSIYQPTKSMENNKKYPAFYSDGWFIHDYPDVDTVLNTPGSLFNAAIPVSAGYPLMQVDTTKTLPNYMNHLLNIEGIHPVSSEVIYSYGTSFDSTSMMGKMKHQPVGIETTGSLFKIITLSCPLFYFNPDQSKQFVDFVLQEKFGVFPIGIEEQNGKSPEGSMVNISPNPSNGRFHVNVFLQSPSEIQVTLLDIKGKIIHQPAQLTHSGGWCSFYFDLGSAFRGLFFVQVTTPSDQIIRKLILSD